MNELTVHPDVYSTGAATGLVDLLTTVWTAGPDAVSGALHIVSGFGNYNGGVRFFDIFRRHIVNGGSVSALFAGSASARLTSRQLVEELLQCGVKVTVVNRKRLLHAKAYGRSCETGDTIIVSSGNFTGPGMTQNIELAVLLDEVTTARMGFRWNDLEASMRTQSWDYYTPELSDPESPAWVMLYDEVGTVVPVDESELVSMVLILGHADTARINAVRGDRAARGTQYFWLSKDCFAFFPALTIRNERGRKATYSCIINMMYVDLNVMDEVRVTFEAENNLDFRLGTGKLRSTGLASEGDMAVLTRRGERDYELRLLRQGTRQFESLRPYATHFIGHVGKKFGYLPNGIVDASLQ